MERSFIDPFGAPDVFCTDAVFELAAPGVVRVLMTCRDGDEEAIVKVKLLLPFDRLLASIAAATTFATRAAQGIVGDSPPITLM